MPSALPIPVAAPDTVLAHLSPMLLSESKSRDLSGPDWVFEVKHDGYRMLAQWDAGAVRLKSRNGADATNWFPEVTRSLATLGAGRCIVDGEVCVFDELGRSDFDSLQQRARLRKFKPGSVLVGYYVFDLLVLDGRSVMNEPLVQRKERLQALLDPMPPQLLYAHHVDNEHGEWLFQQALGLKLEGIVAKKAQSTYVPGARSLDWVKRKRPGAVPAQRFARKPR